MSVELAAGQRLLNNCPPCKCNTPLSSLEVATAGLGFADNDVGGVVPTLLPIPPAAFLATTAVTTPMVPLLTATPSMMAMMTPATVTAMPNLLTPTPLVLQSLPPAPCADQGELDAMQAQIRELQQIIDDQNSAMSPAPMPQPPEEFGRFPALPQPPLPPPSLPVLPEVDPSLAAGYATLPPESPYRNAGSPVPASASAVELQLHASQNAYLVKAKEIEWEPSRNECSCPCRQKQLLRLQKASSSTGFLSPKTQ